MATTIAELQWQEFSQLRSLQILLDDFATLTSISLVIMDANGKPVTQQTTPHNKLCMDLIKATQLGKSLCDQCDMTWGAEAAAQRSYRVYTCRHGLVDFVSPIMFEGQVLGYLFGGQLRIGREGPSPDRAANRRDEDVQNPELFRMLDDFAERGVLIDMPTCWHERHAKELGIDKGEYLRALAEIPVMRPSNIEAAARVLHNIANNISSYVSKWIEQQRQESGLRDTIARLQREAEAKTEFAEEVKWALESREIARGILVELEKTAPYRTASLQLIRGDTRTLLAGRGFDAEGADRGLLRPISRDSLIRRVVRSREPLILPNPADDPDWDQPPGTRSIRSWIGLPVVFDETVIGLLTLDHEEPGFYTQDLRPSLIAFARRVAPRIWHARLWNSAQRLIRDMEVVNDVVKIISAQVDTQDLLRTVSTKITEQLRCSKCAIFLPERVDGETLLVARFPNARGEVTKPRRFRADEGMAGWVFTHGASVVLADAAQDARFVSPPNPDREIRSMLVAPIRVGDQTLGVICADQNVPDWFSESDRRLVDALAQQAGIAIQRSTAVALLQDIANRIISPESVDDILREVAHGAIRLSNTTAGIIYLLNEDGRSLFNAYRTSSFDHPAPRLDSENGITRTVFRTGEVLRIADIQRDDRVNPSLKGTFRSMLAVPLKVGDRVIGVLYLNDIESHVFTDTEVSLLLALATQAAIALEKAKLVASLHQQLAIHSALEDVMQRLVVQEQDQDDALNSIGEGIRKILGAEVTPTINLYNEETDTFGDCHAWGPLARELSVPPRSEGGTGRYALKHRLAIYQEDVRYPAPGYPRIREDSIRLDIRSFAAIPLTRQKSILGILFINSQKPLRFDLATRHALSILASHAGVAIEIARLHETAFYASLIKTADLGYLASGVSHEFLHTLQRVKLLEEQMRRLSTEHEKHRDLDLLLVEYDRGVRTIDTFKTFQARSGSDDPLDLAVLVENLVELSERRAMDHNIKLNYCLGILPKVRIDASLFQSIIVNLMRNAMDAVETLPGERCVRVELLCPDERNIEIAVHDSGPGIPPKLRARIFDPFFTTKGSKSMGIGLFWVQRIVRRLDGQIQLKESDLGGMTFRVIIPLNTMEQV